MNNYKIIFDEVAWSIMSMLGYRYFIVNCVKEPRPVDSLDELDNLPPNEQGVIELFPFKSKSSANIFYHHVPKVGEDWSQMDEETARHFQVIGSKVYLHLA
jgi:hypothetical protein